MTRKLSMIALAAAAAALVAAGCSSPAHEPTELQKIRELVKADSVWSASLGDSLTGLLAPAVTAEGVFAAGEDR
ncbi:MAG: outer membrane protein assembly factor BamB, partial [Duodenibacillus sp.]|nr:outer membrane protein assembly factor BamB [Duodenibacillus sp.]